MNQTPSKVIYTVVIAIALLDTLCVGTLCLSLFRHTYADPSILTALISTAGILTGALVALLSNTRTQPPATATESTITTTPIIPLASSEKNAIVSTPVTVVNTETDPIPVTPTKG